MGKRGWLSTSVAEGLCSLQRKRFQHSCGHPIHPKPGIPSQENELRNGISRSLEEAQRGIRSEICLRLGVALTALPKFLFELTQPLRDWANFYRASSALRPTPQIQYRNKLREGDAVKFLKELTILRGENQEDAGKTKKTETARFLTSAPEARQKLAHSVRSGSMIHKFPKHRRRDTCRYVFPVHAKVVRRK